MLKTLFLSLFCLTTVARAQTNCARPVIRLLRGNQEMPATGSALLPTVRLQVAPEAGCPEQRYRFRHAQVTLLRRGRPVFPSKLVENSALDLRSWMNAYQSGDQLLVFIAYQNLALVAADGTLTLLLAKAVSPRPGQLDLQTDDSKGISFRWVLRKP